jgi:multidrug efflux pump
MFSIFIKRPVLASTISLLILLIGIRSAFLLSIRQFPEMKNTVITVTTTYPGADSDLMQGLVTQPLQKAVATASGIDYLTSRSATGLSEIKVMVRLNANPDAALTAVMSKVNEVRGSLPRGINDPVIVKSTGETFASLYLAFDSEGMNAQQITDYVSRVVQPKLATVPGVAKPEIMGGQNFAMRIWLDPHKLAFHSISAEEIKSALLSNNVQSAAGGAKGGYDVIGSSARTDLKSEADFRALVVRNEGAKLIRLSDLGEVLLGPENADSSVYVDGRKAVFVGVYTSPEANPLRVVDDIRALLPNIERDMPTELKMRVAYDTTIFIRAAIFEVVRTLIESAIIVMLVIFLFVGSLRSVLIPLVTMPLSLVGAAAILLVFGFSINLLTLLAAVLAIGLVVDDAIVVVENIHRHIENGKSPFNAAIDGTKEIALPVISMTLTLAAVYAPIAFMGGLTGALFKEFALALAGAVIVSGIVALTLSPMMCAKILKAETGREGLSAKLDRLFERIKGAYRRRLESTLADRGPVMLLAGIVFCSLPWLFSQIPAELAPEEDQGAVMVAYSGPVNANIDFIEHFSTDINELFVKLPETESAFTVNGFPSANGGLGATVLKPWAERSRKQQLLVPAIQSELDKIPGLMASAFPLPPLPGSEGGLPIQFVISTTSDYRPLAEISGELLSKARASGLFAFIDADLKYQLPQTIIEIDRDKAAAYGVRMQAIGDTLALLTGGNYINHVNLDGRGYRVIPQVPRRFRLDPEMLGEFYVKTESGTAIPLSSLVELRRVVQPVSLNQFNQQNSATIQAMPMPGVTMGETLAFLEKTAKELLPRGYGYDFAGQSRQYVTEGNALVTTFIFAVLVIFLVLAAQFESFRDPLVILMSVPLSLCGALIPLALGVASMNIYTQVGLVTLIGLITKHGILICEVAKEQQEKRGLDRKAAVLEAASLRLRPILMTTAAMVAGAIPLLLASGAGAASRLSIAIVIVAGMSIGTLFTLFVLPAVYTVLAGERNRRGPTAVNEVQDGYFRG